MENRKNFYNKDFNKERAEENLKLLCGHCSLVEILWIIRNITYDQISYYDENNKGIIYNGDYNNHQKEQATILQKRLSEICDLFSQIIAEKNEFKDDYLKPYLFSRLDFIQLTSENKELKNKLDKISKII